MRCQAFRVNTYHTQSKPYQLQSKRPPTSSSDDQPHLAEKIAENRMTELSIILLVGFGNSKYCYFLNTYLYILCHAHFNSVCAMFVRWLQLILSFIVSSYDCATIAYKTSVLPGEGEGGFEGSCALD